MANENNNLDKRLRELVKGWEDIKLNDMNNENNENSKSKIESVYDLVRLVEDPEISDEEFVAELVRLFKEVDESIDPNDYDINKPQMIKVLEIYEWLEAYANRDKDVIKEHNLTEWESKLTTESIKIQPDLVTGACGLSINLFALKAFSDKLEKFKEILEYCTVFEVLPRTDGTVDISMNIPDVYVKVK